MKQKRLEADATSATSQSETVESKRNNEEMGTYLERENCGKLNKREGVSLTLSKVGSQTSSDDLGRIAPHKLAIPWMRG